MQNERQQLRALAYFFPDIKDVSPIAATGKIKTKISSYLLQCILTNLDATTFKSCLFH